MPNNTDSNSLHSIIQRLNQPSVPTKLIQGNSSCGSDLSCFVSVLVKAWFGHDTLPTTLELDDIKQEAIATILKSLPGYQAKCPFTTWVSTTTRFSGIKQLKQARRTIRQQPILSLVMTDEALTIEDKGNLNPEINACMAETIQGLLTWLSEYVKRTPADAHNITIKLAALQMALIQGYSAVTVAGHLGIPIKDAKKLIHNAKHALHRLLTSDKEAL